MCANLPKILRISALCFLSIIFSFGMKNPVAWAGPPFMTDDPEPVEYLHGELYIASQWARDKDMGTAATLPHFDINYGIAPDVQLTTSIPIAYSAPRDSSAQYGIGDIEAGVKYRFIHEDNDSGWASGQRFSHS